MNKEDTIKGAISNIAKELREIDKAILPFEGSKHESFNRLLTRIELLIEEEKRAWN